MKVVSSEASHGELGLTAVTCQYQGREPLPWRAPQVAASLGEGTQLDPSMGGR